MRLAVLCLLPLCLRADSFDDLRLRWRRMLSGGAFVDTTLPAVGARLSAIESTARRNWTSMLKDSARQSLWTDLSRANISSGISASYSRLRAMALAWATPGQALYGDPGLLADIRSGLAWMDANRYNQDVPAEYDNWWDWEIGTPLNLADIGVLLYDNLSSGELDRYMAAIERFDSDPRYMIGKTISTGANRTDKCKAALLRGVLLKDPAKIELAVRELSPVFDYVTAGDGFYLDGSFIQHRRHPYTGSYGLVLIADIADLLYLTAGSPWETSGPPVAIASQWISGAFAPLIFRGAMMDMVRGRAISRDGSSDHAAGHSTIAALLRATHFLGGADAATLRGQIKAWLAADTSRDYSSGLPIDLIGEAWNLLNDDDVPAAAPPNAGIVYASMDRIVHLRRDWAMGIAMHSSRIYNYESINNENLKGWHTGDGMTYLYNADLTQFSGAYWPTIDAQRMPGTTVIAGSTPRQSQLGASNIAGGATVDGYTAAMLDLEPDGRPLSANKSWFLLDDEVVALGAGIRSANPSQAVETIVENRRLTSPTTFTTGTDGSWAHLDAGIDGASIGYYFPAGAGWQTTSGMRAGAWRDINAGGGAALLSAAYRTIWFDHGKAPAAGVYAYVLLPGITAGGTADYAAAPAVSILENSTAAQAIWHGGLQVAAVNFWSNSNKTVAGITSDSIASLVTHASGQTLAVGVSDPTQANDGRIHIELAVPASDIVSLDAGITVEQLSPAIKLAVDVKGARGRTFHAVFSSAQ